MADEAPEIWLLRDELEEAVVRKERYIHLIDVWITPPASGGVAYVRRALVAAQVREAVRAALEPLRGALAALPGGEWETWTSCSFRRITAKGGPDGGVLHALTQRSDGHPDLSWREEECKAICAIVNGLRAQIARLDAMSKEAPDD
jgi:hypothetical protein